MGIEYELKFRATRQVQTAILEAVPGEDRHFSMQTTYYDTPTGQLSRRHYTLRRRMENDLSVCTLKTPAPGGGRGEWEVPCPWIEDALDMLCKLSGMEELPSLLAEGLVAVCGARFRRIARTVRLENCILELAIDEGVLMGGGQEIPLCEIEVELKEGSADSCNRFAAALAARFALEPEPRSKFRRALALYKGE